MHLNGLMSWSVLVAVADGENVGRSLGSHGCYSIVFVFLIMLIV